MERINKLPKQNETVYFVYPLRGGKYDLVGYFRYGRPKIETSQKGYDVTLQIERQIPYLTIVGTLPHGTANPRKIDKITKRKMENCGILKNHKNFASLERMEKYAKRVMEYMTDVFIRRNLGEDNKPPGFLLVVPEN